ncbi:MAG: hypothetical protein ACBR16_26310, partial [Microcoleus sp.]
LGGFEIRNKTETEGTKCNLSTAKRRYFVLLRNSQGRGGEREREGEKGRGGEREREGEKEFFHP